MGSWTNGPRTRFLVPGPRDGRLLPGAERSSANGPGWCHSLPTATTYKSSQGGPCTGRALGQRQLLRKVGPLRVNGLRPDRKPDGFPLSLWPNCLGPKHSEAPPFNFTQARTTCEGTRPKSRHGNAVLQSRATAHVAAGLSF